MQKHVIHVNLVDLVTSFPTHILLQKLASIQKRTSPLKFDHLAEKSESAVRYLSPSNQGPPEEDGREGPGARPRGREHPELPVELSQGVDAFVSTSSEFVRNSPV